MKNKGGFTLIEILVVLLIIGISLGFALLAFGDFGGDRRIIMAAEQFVNYIQFIQHEALLENNTLGIRLDQNSYQMMRFDTTNNWQTVPSKNIFRPHYFPRNAMIQFDGTTVKSPNPQIIINPSGDMNNFILTVGTSKLKNLVKVVGYYNGSITLQLVDKP
jgi:general secretion pathway protein H